MHDHRQNPGFGLLCDAVAYRRLVVVTGSGVSVGVAQPGSELTSLPTWHLVLSQLRARFAARLGAAAADVDLLLTARPRVWATIATRWSSSPPPPTMQDRPCTISSKISSRLGSLLSTTTWDMKMPIAP